MGRTGTTRRGALLAVGAAAGGLLTACTDGDDDGSRGPTSAAAVRAAKALRVKSAGTSRELLLQYDAVLARHPDQATRLTPLRGAVARHVTALSPPQPSKKKDGSAKPSPSSSASSAPSAPSSAPSLGTAAGDTGDGASGPAPSVPADPGAAIRELAAAERRASDAHADALVHAPPELARLLASLAAADAAHAYLLTEGFSS
ncbi:hypothetical protein [Streptomyces sp. IB2014 016-6]|uniref:hypothetical protein n=1 Tax=Streptomyces sp. IB2014 016-6 TaxID=2517818 RepID=UPI0011C942AF|nr:hypothetical protein [Streptomyces sp. IB2014 016-6]TXL84120.1 hypothetical protein EW053_35490 [Streptomyces sp. IB2014 016-6]